MPNWCENTLIVTGSNDRVKQFMEETCHEKDNGDKELRFSAHFPEPDGVDWWNWRVANWGTKWEGQIYSLTLTENELTIGFSSAWSPPTEWLKKIALIFPELNFELTYMETGVWFAGKCFAQGEDFEHYQGDIQQEDENGEEVKYNSEKGLYEYAESGELIEDEDFIPIYSVI